MAVNVEPNDSPNDLTSPAEKRGGGYLATRFQRGNAKQGSIPSKFRSGVARDGKGEMMSQRFTWIFEIFFL